MFLKLLEQEKVLGREAKFGNYVSLLSKLQLMLLLAIPQGSPQIVKTGRLDFSLS
jgi:hypothetical protein